jgi:hypothetical protein
VTIELEAKLGTLRRQLDIDQPPGCRSIGSRGAKLHQQGFAVEAHAGKPLEPTPKPFQLAPPHGAFFVNARAALGKNINLLPSWQQLHLDALTNRMPRQSEQRLLQLGKPPLRGTNQIRDRRVSLPHLSQHFFGRNTAVHDPDALCLAILAFDPLQESA